MTAEDQRLLESKQRTKNWQRWGPYLSERQWGTVREDYSEGGDTTWAYFPHDHARSRAYRWGEDGLLGVCDRQCRLCLSVGLWNGRDAILKETLVRRDGPGRQPRRRRQRVLLLHRQHSDAQLHGGFVQVSAKQIPVQRARRCQPHP